MGGREPLGAGAAAAAHDASARHESPESFKDPYISLSFDIVARDGTAYYLALTDLSAPAEGPTRAALQAAGASGLVIWMATARGEAHGLPSGQSAAAFLRARTAPDWFRQADGSQAPPIARDAEAAQRDARARGRLHAGGHRGRHAPARRRHLRTAGALAAVGARVLRPRDALTATAGPRNDGATG